MKNKKGFTLVELLSVVVILGIIALISVPIYKNIQDNNNTTSYKYYEKMVKNATQLYMEGYSSEIAESKSCFHLDYQTLVSDGLLKEENYTCQGTIVGTRTSSNNYTYKYYLDCQDQKGKYLVKEFDSAPTDECLGVNKKYKIYYDVTYLDTKEKYNGEVTNRDIYQTFSNNDDYHQGLDHYEYSYNNKDWTSFSGDAITTNQSLKTTVYVRAVDKAGNKSNTISYLINVDKTNPECRVYGNDTWTANPVTVTLSCYDKDNGCKTANQFIPITTSSETYSYPSYVIEDNAGNSTTCPAGTVNVKYDKDKPTLNISNPKENTWTNQTYTISLSGGSYSGITYQYKVGNSGWTPINGNTISINTNQNTTYTIVSVNKAGVMSDEKKTIAKFDNTKPTCAPTGGNGNWTNNTITLTGVCTDNLSGCTKNVTKTFSTNTNLTNQTPGTVYDNAGNATNCAANQTVKVDKTAPTCTSSGDSTTWTNGNRTIYYGCNDPWGSGCASGYSGGNKTFTSSTHQSTIGAYTIKDWAGNTVTCPARTANVYVDKDAPTITAVEVSGKTGWFTLNDNVGVVSYAVSNGTGTPAAGWVGINQTTSIRLNWTAGSAGTYYVHTKDVVGNTAYARFDIPTTAFCQYNPGQTWDFGYNGGVQGFSVPCSGTYKLEVWGAQGGTAGTKGYVGENSSLSGGLGGYSTGTVSLSKSTGLYIAVGGQPGHDNSSNNYGVSSCSHGDTDDEDNFTCNEYHISGGYNGGGDTYENYNNGYGHANPGFELIGGAGGGATHIAKNTNRGELANYVNNKDEVLIVAGGGGGTDQYARWEFSGGGSDTCRGGAGGDTNGTQVLVDYFTDCQNYDYDEGDCTSRDTSYTVFDNLTYHNIRVGQFPTQTYGNSFGKGDKNSGGGWYGGYKFGMGCGSGGSGYTGGVSNGTMSSGSREGHGYARITYVSAN